MQPNDLDQILQREYPLHVVGVHSPFEPLRAPGSRLLLTADGLHLEACNGVYHSVQSLAELNTDIALPYGSVPCGITTLDPVTAEKLPALVKEFERVARAASPVEAIMLVVKAPGRPARCIHPERNATPGRVTYDDVAHMEPGEEVILDIHSHGSTRAFFSTEDDADDRRFRGSLKRCYVIGTLDEAEFSYTSRWVSRGHIFDQQDVKVRARHEGEPAC